MITIDPVRWAGAALLLSSYAGMCLAVVCAVRKRSADAGGGEADWLVAHASQTGTGEYLAQQTADTLRAAGLAARSISVEDLDDATLRSATRILFIASTYGEGDPPDSGARFASRLARATAQLSQLHFGVMALGDSTYSNYCGFGRWLDQALQARGAQPLFGRIEVDRGAGPGIAEWQHHLSHLAGTADAPDWVAPAYEPWRIAERKLVNPGSAGAPVFHLSLVPAAGALPAWEAGDLVQLSPPSDPDYPREYSIASAAADGRLDLLVRLHVRDDGSDGAASGWLCQGATAQDTLALRVRPHTRFRLGANATRPLILIGNGTGIAGLRAHLRARIANGDTRNWLLFGERNEARDFFFRQEIETWRREGSLECLVLAFSRDHAGPRYVQDALSLHAEQLRTWVEQDAAIYVCGSLQGMASGVHQVLVDALGAAAVEALEAEGRYRRDVY
ncbi:sulfite reductase subunit alpha [Massilia cavernae]|uniref:NADPH--hemoprotein reductase n=1 Tax=Massilia cavernae TaxID=2320864 RepID=A0A418XG38_9BURK|nr:sulfite reductase subunit alpha [Massilia cavernae]RJG11421.1 oxidoreductase [Massilia cavernae]